MARQPISLDHIPPEHHHGIGLVSNAWAYLEGTVERIIWRLAGIDDDNIGIALTTHMGIKARLDAACALAHHRFPDAAQTKRLEALKKHINGADMYGKRNEIVHSRVLHFQSLGGATTLRPTYKARGKVRKGLNEAVPEEYADTAKRFLNTASELQSMLSDYLDLLQGNADAL